MEDMENKIIGQNKIISQINSFDLDTCPRSIILMGKKGSGRHLISEYISNHLEVELVNLTNKLT